MRIVDPNDLQCQDKSADDQHMNDRPKVAEKSWTPSFLRNISNPCHQPVCCGMISCHALEIKYLAGLDLHAIVICSKTGM